MYSCFILLYGMSRLLFLLSFCPCQFNLTVAKAITSYLILSYLNFPTTYSDNLVDKYNGILPLYSDVYAKMARRLLYESIFAAITKSETHRRQVLVVFHCLHGLSNICSLLALKLWKVLAWNKTYKHVIERR